MAIANSLSHLTILENGDRLDRDEFERRYAASNIKKAELIEGADIRSTNRLVCFRKWRISELRTRCQWNAL
ncbi:hypothetical protein TUMEXPCC7403_00145 [Tumidithrix helvetica PCC 7403]